MSAANGALLAVLELLVPQFACSSYRGRRQLHTGAPDTAVVAAGLAALRYLASVETGLYRVDSVGEAMEGVITDFFGHLPPAGLSLEMLAPFITAMAQLHRTAVGDPRVEGDATSSKQAGTQHTSAGPRPSPPPDVRAFAAEAGIGWVAWLAASFGTQLGLVQDLQHTTLQALICAGKDYQREYAVIVAVVVIVVQQVQPHSAYFRCAVHAASCARLCKLAGLNGDADELYTVSISHAAGLPDDPVCVRLHLNALYSQGIVCVQLCLCLCVCWPLGCAHSLHASDSATICKMLKERWTY